MFYYNTKLRNAKMRDEKLNQIFFTSEI